MSNNNESRKNGGKKKIYKKKTPKLNVYSSSNTAVVTRIGMTRDVADIRTVRTVVIVAAAAAAIVVVVVGEDIRDRP